MSNEKQESLADIIAEIRDLSRGVNYWKLKYREPLPTAFDKPLDIYLAVLADRLEAALKREKAKIETDALAVGGIVEAARHKPSNAAAMRVTLVKVIGLCNDAIDGGEYMGEGPDPAFDKIKELLSAALAAPPRNCDVGTAEEQYDRFREYCFSKRCESLIKKTTLGSEVAFAWAQMPYEEGDAK